MTRSKTPTPKSKKVTKKPAAKKPVTKKPVAKKLVTKKPVTKKPAAKKPVAKKPIAAKVDAEAPLYTLAELTRKAGEATEAEVRTQVGNLDKAALVDSGRLVATDRVSVDCARIYGRALDFLKRATAAQRGTLLGMSDRLLRAAIWSAHKGQTTHAALSQQSSGAALNQNQRRSTSAALLDEGIRRRDQLHAVCEQIIGDDPAHGDTLNAAYSKSSNATELAASLSKLGKLAEKLLRSKDAGIVARRADSGLTDAYLKTTHELADKLAQAGSAAGSTRAATATSQGEVDLWDGMNLILLRRILSIWNAAHAIDPAIPRLYAISLHRALYGRVPKKPAAAPKPTDLAVK